MSDDEFVNVLLAITTTAELQTPDIPRDVYWFNLASAAYQAVKGYSIPEEFKGVTINSDPDNPRNLLLACIHCPDIVIPVRFGITLTHAIELINIHVKRDHGGSEPTDPVTSR